MKRGGTKWRRLFRKKILLTSVIFFTAFGLLLLMLHSLDPNSSFIDEDDDDAVSESEETARWSNSSSTGDVKVDGARLCSTVEEMGSEFEGGFVDQSLRVRDVIRRHFHVNGASVIRELPPEKFCRHGYVLGKTAEAGF